MKFPLIFFLLFAQISSAQTSADRPVAGKDFTVTYDPAEKGILHQADQLRMVYAFDYWGTTTHQKLRGEGGLDDLFLNVLTPDEGRAHTVEMSRTGNTWIAFIGIPKDAALLSYYITDGTATDYNDRRTYTSYIYGEDGQPVRNARLRNIDFLFMVYRPISEIIAEVKREIEDYPDNFIAHVVRWRFPIFETIDPDTLMMMCYAVNDHFDGLYETYGIESLPYKIMSLNDINRVVMLSMRERLADPPVVALVRKVNTTIRIDHAIIPSDKVTASVASIRRGVDFFLMDPEERQEIEDRSRKDYDTMLAEMVGEQAPDFTFTSLNGKSGSLSAFSGKYVLLDFWGSWCGPCVAEIPNLKKVYERFGRSGLVMISISNDADARGWGPSELSAFTQAHGMLWIQVLEERGSPINDLYGIRVWPNMFLIGPDGTVLQRQGLRGNELIESLDGLLQE